MTLWFWRIVARADGGATFGSWETPRRLNHHADVTLADRMRSLG